jgi:hypothetical protein
MLQNCPSDSSSRLLKNPQTGVDPLLSDWDFQSSRR